MLQPDEKFEMFISWIKTALPRLCMAVRIIDFVSLPSGDQGIQKTNYSTISRMKKSDRPAVPYPFLLRGIKWFYRRWSEVRNDIATDLKIPRDRFEARVFTLPIDYSIAISSNSFKKQEWNLLNKTLHFDGSLCCWRNSCVQKSSTSLIQPNIHDTKILF